MSFDEECEHVRPSHLLWFLFHQISAVNLHRPLKKKNVLLPWLVGYQNSESLYAIMWHGQNLLVRSNLLTSRAAAVAESKNTFGLLSGKNAKYVAIKSCSVMRELRLVLTVANNNTNNHVFARRVLSSSRTSHCRAFIPKYRDLNVDLFSIVLSNIVLIWTKLVKLVLTVLIYSRLEWFGSGWPTRTKPLFLRYISVGGCAVHA